MKYRFVAEHRNAHSVEMMARVLKVARSGFYAWLNRQPSSRTELKSVWCKRCAKSKLR